MTDPKPDDCGKHKTMWYSQVGLLAMIVFSAGVGWQQLATLADEVDDASHHPVSAAEVAVMKVKQENIARDVAEIKQEQKDQGKKIDAILQAVK